MNSISLNVTPTPGKAVPLSLPEGMLPNDGKGVGLTCGRTGAGSPSRPSVSGRSSCSRFQTTITGSMRAAALVLILLAQDVCGQSFGNLAAPFLRISPNARQVGMGEAFTAMANEHNALRYNVAGLALLEHMAFSLNYHNWIDDTNQGNIEVSLPMSRGVVGFGLTFFDQGEINALDENFQPTLNEGGSNDVILTGAYSTSVGSENNMIAFGGGGKFIRQDLAGFSSSALGIDIGATYITQYLSFGLTLQNLTLKKAKFDNRSDVLPQTLRAGAAGRFQLGPDMKLNLATDVAKMRDDGTVRVYTGTELQVSDMFAIRTGYKLHDREASRWALGLGLTVPTQWFANSKTNVDYAYSPLDDFDTSIHRFSFTFTFGVLEPPPQMDPLAVQRLSEIQRQMEDRLKDTEEAQRLAQEARRQAEDARRRAEEATLLAEMRAEELGRRLARIDSIAAASGGKIEVTHVPDTSRINVSLRINFDFDKAVIRPSEFATMGQIAEVLNTFPESKLLIAGHTDSIGTQVYNFFLSERRMESVRRHLISDGNTGDRFFMPVPYGETRPIADNGSSNGRARNRRVDFTIFTRDAQPDMPDGSAIVGVEAVGDTSITIVANGRVTFRKYELENPKRIVYDFPGVFSLSPSETFEFVGGSVWRARIGFHPEKPLTRVVFDVIGDEDVEYAAQVVDNKVVVGFESAGMITRKR